MKTEETSSAIPGDVELDRKLEQLRRLRDEIRLQRHLVTMDALDSIERLERRLTEVERKVRDQTTPRAALARALHEIHESLGAIREHMAAPH